LTPGSRKYIPFLVVAGTFGRGLWEVTLPTSKNG